MKIKHQRKTKEISIQREEIDPNKKMTMICQAFRAGHCSEAKNCCFSHILNNKRKGSKTRLLSIPQISVTQSISARLKQLKTVNYLSGYMIKELPENMHYEICKYLNWNELLVIRAINLTGYQIVTNKVLRKRIGGNISGKVNSQKLWDLLNSTDMLINVRRKIWKSIFELRGCSHLDLKDGKLGEKHIIRQLADNFRYLPQLTILLLGTNNSFI